MLLDNNTSKTKKMSLLISNQSNTNDCGTQYIKKTKNIIFVNFDDEAIKYECLWTKNIKNQKLSYLSLLIKKQSNMNVFGKIMQQPKTIIFVTLDDKPIKYECFWIKKKSKTKNYHI